MVIATANSIGPLIGGLFTESVVCVSCPIDGAFADIQDLAMVFLAQSAPHLNSFPGHNFPPPLEDCPRRHHVQTPSDRLGR